MKVNRSTFSKIKQQYEILRMKAAYIEAEKAIMANPNLTGFADAAQELMGVTEVIRMTPEEFNDRVANTQDLTIKDIQIMELEAKLANMEEKGREYMNNEQYEELAELKDWYDATKRQLDKLRDGKKGS